MKQDNVEKTLDIEESVKIVKKRIKANISKPKRFGTTFLDRAFRMYRKWARVLVLIAVVVLFCTSSIWLNTWTTDPPKKVNDNAVYSLRINLSYRILMIGQGNGIVPYNSIDDTPTASQIDPFSLGTSNWAKDIEFVRDTDEYFALLGSGTSRLIHGNVNGFVENYTLGLGSPDESNLRDIAIEPNGSLLYAVGCSGLAIYNFTESTIKRIHERDGLLSNTTLTVITVSDYVLVGCSNGISIVNTKTFGCTNKEFRYGDQKLSPTSIATKQDLSRIYVGTQKGMFVLKLENGSLNFLPEASASYPEISSSDIRALKLLPSEKTLFIGTDRGLSWYDVLEDAVGGALTGRFHLDTIQVNCLESLDMDAGIKLYIGTDIGLYWIEGASLISGGRFWQTLILEIPDILSLFLSVIALLFSFSIFFHETTTASKTGDIKALNALRQARDSFRYSWPLGYQFDCTNLGVQECTDEKNAVKKVLVQLQEDKDHILENLSESISSCSKRYSKDLYELMVRYHLTDVYDIAQYQIYNADYYTLAAGWSMKQFLGLPITNPESEAARCLEVGNLMIFFSSMIERIETVYFDKKIEHIMLESM